MWEESYRQRFPELAGPGCLFRERTEEKIEKYSQHFSRLIRYPGRREGKPNVGGAVPKALPGADGL